MTQHPAAAHRSAAARDPDAAADWARTIGGLLFAAGALVLYLRKSSEVDGWGDFALLLVLLVPCAALLAAAALDREAGVVDDARAPRAWRSAYLVLGVLLVPAVLMQFVDTIGGDGQAALNVAWIFLVTAVVALVSSLRFAALYQALIAGLALIVAWVAVWDRILDDPETDTVRWLLVVIAALLVAGAVALRRAGLAQGTELVTAAGVAGVIAGAVGAFQAAAQIVGQGLFAQPEGEAAGTGWDLFLLVASVALIAYAARTGARGPGYAGGAGLVAFVFVVGAELAALVEGEEGDHQFFGWPAILLLLGIAAFVAGTVLARGDGRGGAPPRDAVLDQWGGERPPQGP